jgi:hypothetical protein
VSARIVVSADPVLKARLHDLARSPRMVFVAGLPGTGKSLMIHQIAHLAAAAGRLVHLLQWDVIRPVFEASEVGRRYPVVDGVTHAVVRKAVGRWVRDALVRWERSWPAREHLLIGETPFIGHRLIELAHRMDDAAEPILAAPSCRFVITVPSVAVRAVLEGERQRRTAAPLHPREREDAPPHMLRDLWRELIGVARALGIPVEGRDAERAYDPVIYRRVYEALLRHRHVEVLALDTVLPTATLSVYDFAVPNRDLAPGPDEANAMFRQVEAWAPDPAALAPEAERWWVV